MAFRVVQKSAGSPSVKRSEIRSAVRSVVSRDSSSGRFIERRRGAAGARKSTGASSYRTEKAPGSKRRTG
jgi:hypothetical protein